MSEPWTAGPNRMSSVWLGGATIWVGGDLWKFRPPWSRAVFSERYGNPHMIFNFLGWRLFVTPKDQHP